VSAELAPVPGPVPDARESAPTGVLRFTRRNYGSGHGYSLDGERIPGVTTVVGKLGKPALTGWAARMAAEYAVDHWGELAGLGPTARLGAIKGAADRASRVAMTRGSRVHAFGAALATGRAVDVPEELAEPVEAYARFLDRWHLEPVATELPVCSTRYGYGGTLDAIYRHPDLGNILVDIKTGGVYADHALQLAAYRHADLTMGDKPMIETTGAYVAHILGDDVELIPVSAGAAEFRTFLYLLAIYRWTKSADDDSPVGRAIYPEDVSA
jgi:hypothetical protein